MSKLSTVKVKYRDSFMLMNESDFNPDTHELFVEKEALEVKDIPDPEEEPKVAVKEEPKVAVKEPVKIDAPDAKEEVSKTPRRGRPANK